MEGVYLNACAVTRTYCFWQKVRHYNSLDIVLLDYLVLFSIPCSLPFFVVPRHILFLSLHFLLLSSCTYTAKYFGDAICHLLYFSKIEKFERSQLQKEWRTSDKNECFVIFQSLNLKLWIDPYWSMSRPLWWY